MSREIHWSTTDLQESLDRRLNMPVARIAVYQGGLLVRPSILGFAYGLGFPVIGDFLALGGSGLVTFTWSNWPDAAGYQIQVFTGGVWVNYGGVLPAGSIGTSNAEVAGTYIFRLQVLTAATTYSNQSTAVVT